MTAWALVRKKTKVQGRWRRQSQTVITELSENGASWEAIKSLVGHGSDAVVERYSHIRMEAKRAAVEKIAANQREAQQKPTATVGGVQ